MGFKKTMTELVGNDRLYHKLWLMLQISRLYGGYDSWNIHTNEAKDEDFNITWQHTDVWAISMLPAKPFKGKKEDNITFQFLKCLELEKEKLNYTISHFTIPDRNAVNRKRKVNS